MSEKAITTTDNGASIMPVVDTAGLLSRYKLIKDIREQVMEEGEHFGVVPGTSGKPTLYKPGAEVLCAAFALYPEFEALNEVTNWDADEPFFFFRYRCTLKSRDGRFTVGSGIGSCNSREKKYRWRSAERICPHCEKPTIIKGKEEYGGGWLCWYKKGGCGAKFDDGDPAIEGQEVGQVPNPDIADQVNTIDKMAQKRALVAATLVAVGASNFFTQDVEDLPNFAGAREVPGNGTKTQDAVEGEVVTGTPVGAEKSTQATQGPPYTAPRPHAPGVVKAFFDDAEDNDTKEGPREPLENDTRQTVFLKVGHLFPDILTRKRFQLWAFGVPSIADMTNGQGRAYWRWADKPALAKRELDDILASPEFAEIKVEADETADVAEDPAA